MKISRIIKAGFLSFCLAAGFVRSVIAQPDFTFTIEPSSLTLVPGQSASFVVSLTPLNGFTNQVSLSVTNLTSGVTASFSPQSLTPPGTSVLTLAAATDASNGSFMLNVIATGGGITNEASSSVSVSFGLLPICYGAFQGTVTDATTGQPIPFAAVNASGYLATADASGQYLITNLPLSSSENLPTDYGVTASQTNYWPSTDYAYAVCDATNTVDLQIIREQTGSISGYLTSTEDGQPLTNVTVIASYEGIYPYPAVTSTNGFFQFDSLQLGNDNAAAYYTLQTQPDGYWEVYSNTTIQANSNSVVNLAATPICYTTVTGTVFYANTGLPATNAAVLVSTTYEYYATTDSNGNYVVTNVTLGTDNTKINASIQASAAGYYTTTTNLILGTCTTPGFGPPIYLTPVPPPPPVTNNYGAIGGYVYDVQTGLPIAGASLEAFSSYYYYATTDTNGAYLMTNVLVGTGAVTNTYYDVQASANHYFAVASNLIVNAGETNMQNLYLLRIGYGYIVGTILDSATGQPVAGVYVSISGQTTGANGQYASGPLQLAPGNAPTYESFYAQEPGYWMIYTSTTISNNVTNVVNIDLIQVCTGATIVGNVVDALTQQPITNASITLYGPIDYYAMTDTNGNFIFTNVTVGNDNSPSAVTLQATAPGFNPQSKTLTIFCDATISTEFGAPETAFGAIDGYVTNAVTGQPLTNVFIGSSFGGSTYTDTNGYYILQQAPLGANGSNRTWTVTAGPVTIGTTPYPAQTKSVIVSSNMTNLLDFGFGQPLTELVVTNVGTPNPVTVGSNLLYSVTLTNLAADAANVVLSDTLPPGVTYVEASISNNPGGAFSAPVQQNGVVTITAANLASQSGVILLVTVTPTAAGMITNVATVTSDTPDTNTTGSGRTSTAVNTVVAPVIPKTELVVTNAGTPNPVTVGSNLLYTIILTNLAADAANVALSDTLPPGVTYVEASIVNNPGGAFNAPVQQNGVVTITAANLASQSGVILLVTATPTVAGMTTNVATVTSDTPDVDATGSGRTSTAVNTVVAPVIPKTELVVTNVGTPNPVTVGSNLLYTVTLTNLAADAANVALSDTLSPGVTYVEASISNNPGGAFSAPVQQNGVVTITAANLASQSGVILLVTVTPTVAGTITNVATVTSDTPDTNATGSGRTSKATNTVVAPNGSQAASLSVVANPAISLNFQTGLFQQTVQVNNTGGAAATAVSLSVLGLPKNVMVYNASGTNDGVPYVEYNYPVPAGGSVVFLLEYYDPTRTLTSAQSPAFSATVIAAVVVPPPTGTFVPVDPGWPRFTMASPLGQLLTIEFPSIPGHAYVVQYSSDLMTWQTATPPIVAINSRTVWIDDGPPDTETAPGSAGQRYYRILQTH